MCIFFCSHDDLHVNSYLYIYDFASLFILYYILSLCPKRTTTGWKFHLIRMLEFVSVRLANICLQRGGSEHGEEANIGSSAWLRKYVCIIWYLIYTFLFVDYNLYGWLIVSTFWSPESDPSHLTSSGASPKKITKEHGDCIDQVL